MCVSGPPARLDALTRRSTSFRRIGAARRQSSWIAGPFGLVSAISASSKNVYPTGTIALDSGLTVVRTRGELLVYLTTVGGAVTEGFSWALGFAIVTEQAAAIGATAIPSPITDIGWDGWYLYETGQVAITAAAEAINSASNTQVVRVPLDSKAMRKYKESDVIVAVLAVTEVGDGSVVASHLNSRVLVKVS